MTLLSHLEFVRDKWPSCYGRLTPADPIRQRKPKGRIVTSRTTRVRGRAFLACAAVLVLALQQAPASAQDFSGMIDSSFANMSSFAGTTAVNSAIAESARYAAGQRPRARQQPRIQSPQAAPRPANLSFRPSAAVTSQVNARILAAIRQNSPDVDIAGLKQALDSGQLHGTFAQLLRSAGFSPTDLADVLTGYLVISWEVVNGEDSRRHAGGYAVVRDRLRHSLAADPRVARMNDADKQQFAETLEVLAILAAATRDGLNQAGQPQKLQALREGVRRAGQNLGIDFRQIAFTDSGFVAR